MFIHLQEKCIFHSFTIKQVQSAEGLLCFFPLQFWPRCRILYKGLSLVFLIAKMVVASDNSWVIPDVKTDELAGICQKKFPFGSKELEIVEKSIDSCFPYGQSERRKKPISKIFRDVVYKPSLEDIKEVDDEDLAEVEDKFDLTLPAIHRERALNSGCFSTNESRKYRKKKYKKSQPPIERRPRSQTV